MNWKLNLPPGTELVIVFNPDHTVTIALQTLPETWPPRNRVAMRDYADHLNRLSYDDLQPIVDKLAEDLSAPTTR